MPADEETYPKREMREITLGTTLPAGWMVVKWLGVTRRPRGSGTAFTEYYLVVLENGHGAPYRG